MRKFHICFAPEHDLARLFGNGKANAMMLKPDARKNYDFRSCTCQSCNTVFVIVCLTDGKLNNLGHFISPRNRQQSFHACVTALYSLGSATLYSFFH